MCVYIYIYTHTHIYNWITLLYSRLMQYCKSTILKLKFTILIYKKKNLEDFSLTPVLKHCPWYPMRSCWFLSIIILPSQKSREGRSGKENIKKENNQHV